MKTGFYSLDTKTTVCPHCGSELVTAEYFSAVKGESSDKQKNGKNITTTKYTDVQKHTGAYCMACLYRKKARLLTLARWMVVLGFLGTAASVILMLTKNNSMFWFPVIACFLVLSVGWNLIGEDDGLFTENPYRGLTKEQIHKTATSSSSLMLDVRSNEFVENFPRTRFQVEGLCCPGRHSNRMQTEQVLCFGWSSVLWKPGPACGKTGPSYYAVNDFIDNLWERSKSGNNCCLGGI